METIKAIAFRYLTNAEFFNINKPSGTETKGGGQTYIDFPTMSVSRIDWEKFFSGTKECSKTKAANGPKWTFMVKSVGVDKIEEISVYQRRAQSIIVAAQKLNSRGSRRVPAWHPDNGFPAPKNPLNRHSLPNGLAVYFVRTDNDEIWAGWFHDWNPCRDAAAENCLSQMVKIQSEGHAGMLFVDNGKLYLDSDDLIRPFSTEGASSPTASIFAKKRSSGRRRKSSYGRWEVAETDLIESLFQSDVSSETEEPDTIEKIVRVKNRNKKSVNDLKKLYNGKCQVSGYDLTFKKKDGEYYSEAHHLVPLGEEGSDSPFNIVIVSPLIHRMLHYAEVSEIDWGKLKPNGTLDISINGASFTVTWHPDHADYVRRYSDPGL